MAVFRLQREHGFAIFFDFAPAFDVGRWKFDIGFFDAHDDDANDGQPTNQHGANDAFYFDVRFGRFRRFAAPIGHAQLDERRPHQPIRIRLELQYAFAAFDVRLRRFRRRLQEKTEKYDGDDDGHAITGKIFY